MWPGRRGKNVLSNSFIFLWLHILLILMFLWMWLRVFFSILMLCLRFLCFYFFCIFVWSFAFLYFSHFFCIFWCSLHILEIASCRSFFLKGDGWVGRGCGAGGVDVAWTPPLRKISNKIILYQCCELLRVNMHPDARAKLNARFGVIVFLSTADVSGAPATHRYAPLGRDRLLRLRGKTL